MKGAPVFGLVLAGGFSRRMGRDKALLSMNGRPQALWTADLLARRCERVMISCRPGQNLGEATEVERVHDVEEGGGPLMGMCLAARRYPDAAWLVAACDLPRLGPEVVDELLDHREDGRDAVAFRSVHDGLPEPLFALYEPGFVPVWEEALRRERRCPRKLLIEQAERVKLVDLSVSDALDNANTPEDLARMTPCGVAGGGK